MRPHSFVETPRTGAPVIAIHRRTFKPRSSGHIAMLDLLEPVIFIAATAAFIWSSFRAWQAESRILKWCGTLLAALCSAILAFVSVLLVVGLFKLHARSAPAVSLNIESTPEQIRRGNDISDGFCSGCHSKWDTLTGGGDIGEDL